MQWLLSNIISTILPLFTWRRSIYAEEVISRKQPLVSRMELAMLLKPTPLVIKRKGDLEQLSEDWEDYVRGFTTFLNATGVA